MKFTALALPGVYEVDIAPAGDERGFFARTFCAEEFSAAGLPGDFVQAPGLGDQVRDAARAQHLEGVQHYHLAAQRFERRRRLGVEPALDVERWRQGCRHGTAARRPGSRRRRR